MPPSRLAALEFALHWHGPLAQHTDRLYFEKLNFWRDFFPGSLAERLASVAVGGSARQDFAPGELVAPWQPTEIHRVRPAQINLQLRDGQTLAPLIGRHYPCGMVTGLPNVFKGDRRPFRYLGEQEGRAGVDLNHPLARHRLSIEGRIVQDIGLSQEHGGRSQDVVQELTQDGPGLQDPDAETATDYYGDRPFARLDERPDEQFYQTPRLVQHLDAQVRQQITELHARFLKPGIRVLDLMASWDSHLPERFDIEVTGLGLNTGELQQNRRLSDFTIHDLNSKPDLLYPAEHFDLAICTASVEYFTQPLEVFRAVRRALKPDAPFVITFSERWFPTKVIETWPMLHPFERLGMVLDVMHRSEGYARLATESARGWPRPPDDQYAAQFPDADPLYAVWGYAA